MIVLIYLFYLTVQCCVRTGDVYLILKQNVLFSACFCRLINKLMYPECLFHKGIMMENNLGQLISKKIL